jgi:hypothetical protein
MKMEYVALHPTLPFLKKPSAVALIMISAQAGGQRDRKIQQTI